MYQSNNILYCGCNENRSIYTAVAIKTGVFAGVETPVLIQSRVYRSKNCGSHSEQRIEEE